MVACGRRSLPGAGMPAELDVVVLGCGCGSTQTYYGQASSSFVLRLDGQPVLMLDVVSWLHATPAWRLCARHTTHASALAHYPPPQR